MNKLLLTLQDPQQSPWLLIVLLGGLLVVFFVFSVLPQQKRRKQLAEMSSRIKVGDKVKTIGGIIGTIVGMSEDEMVFTVLSGSSTFEIDRSCVYSLEMLGVAPAKPQQEEQQDVKVEEPLTESEAPAVEEENK